MARTPLHTITKASQVLDLFSRDRPEWSVSEAAAVLGFPKSSTSELFSSLADYGLLQRTGEGHYRLGWRLMAMSQILLETTAFLAEVRPAMESLVAQFGDTVHLAALEAHQVIFLEKLQGTQAIPIPRTGVGVRLPGHGSAVGKVLLAQQPWAKLRPILKQRGLHAFTPHTITDPDTLGRELARVRAQGYAYDHEELQLGLCCVAAPIYDYSGAVVAALSVAAAARRFAHYQERYRTTLLAVTREVSAALGYLQTRNGAQEHGTPGVPNRPKNGT